MKNHQAALQTEERERKKTLVVSGLQRISGIRRPTRNCCSISSGWGSTSWVI